VVAKTTETAVQLAGHALDPAEVAVHLVDPDGCLGKLDLGYVATYLSMPLRSRSGVIGVLALTSSEPGAFSEEALKTLRVLEQPATVVIDNARLSEWQHQAVS
jgi:GAF domain-containing protein